MLLIIQIDDNRGDKKTGGIYIHNTVIYIGDLWASPNLKVLIDNQFI